jgi:L-ascorbate metabolism protein UlaG (beta-lactamase superfamily)
MGRLEYRRNRSLQPNLTRGPAAGQFHRDQGRASGYVIASGGKRLYFSGDTENRGSDLSAFTNALKGRGVEVRLREWCPKLADVCNST